MSIIKQAATGAALAANLVASSGAQAITRTSSLHMGPAAAESALNSFMSEGGAKLVAGNVPPEFSMAFATKQPYSNSPYAPQQGAGYQVNTPTITSSYTPAG